MDGPHDWDLLAIVRSCTTAKPTVSSPSPPPPPPPPVQQPPLTSSPSSVLFGFSNPLTTTTTTTSFSTGLYHQELQDIFDNHNPLLCSSSTSTSTSSAFTVSQIVKASSSVSQSQRSNNKKRKKLMKKVCHVSNEGLSSDMWAWRKYGQKPIKGSPYPRGYYKCSSSKGCLARKQVERNRSDPKMFIITYTADHNHAMPTHRSTLAGSTRHKPLKSTDTPPASPSPTLASEKSESKTEGHADLMLNDDFYAGFEQLDDVIDDTDCFSELFSTTSDFPWIDSDTVTTTPGTATTTISAVGGV